LIVLVIGAGFLVNSCAESRKADDNRRQAAESARREQLTPEQRTAEDTAPIKAKAKEESEQASREAAKRPTDLAVNDVSAIYAIYQRNEVDGDARFKGRRMAVKGTIKTIATDILDTPYVAFGDGTQFGIFGVQCMFSGDDRASLSGLAPGQTIVIAGTCDGKLGNVILRDCWIYDESAKARNDAAGVAQIEAELAAKRKEADAKRAATASSRSKRF
jgi:hypothetical protein